MISNKELRIISLLILDTVFFFIEISIGYMSHSLALIADSFHMLNDIFSLLIALWAVNVAKHRGPDSKYTYGWKRAEILGALVNAIFLIALCFSIFIEAVQRLIEVPIIENPKLVMWVGIAGLISNIVGLFLFHELGHGDHSHGHSHSHNHSHSSLHNHENDILIINNSNNNSNDIEDATINDILPEQIVSVTLDDVDHLMINNEHDEIVNHAHFDTTEYNKQLFQTEHQSEVEIETANQHNSMQHHPSQLHSDSHSHAKATNTDLEGQNYTNGNHSTGKTHSHSLNMQGVFLHVLGDALGNIGVIAAAIFIWKTDYSWKYYSDPLVSILITMIIFSSAIPLSRRASRILLQATPISVSTDKIESKILKISNIVTIHDFHIWNLTESISIASIHIKVKGDTNDYLRDVKRIRNIFHSYNIHSVTIQPEFITPGEPDTTEQDYHGSKFSSRTSSNRSTIKKSYSSKSLQRKLYNKNSKMTTLASLGKDTRSKTSLTAPSQESGINETTGYGSIKSDFNSKNSQTDACQIDFMSNCNTSNCLPK